ncbi:MAG: ribosomal RNA small subunit methyltransferase A [Bdellovibrionales bacterium CG10_big_fil_rev_8_21_14_0_10_45_34]|nr:MAG: ribosomal RNA small subunit methyltransferase A [Bdellovibrionales bacterium CG10_big_fil_rev_8_21_14_0_10_45_34]
MAEYSVQKLLARLGELKRNPNKKLGQNFLVNQQIVAKIIAAAKLDRPTLEGQVIEIGPGLGALTEELVKLDRTLLLIEMDRDWVTFWQAEGLDVIQADALRFDWSKVDRSVLVSNLPYQIAASLVVDLSVEDCAINEMVLMFQKEVAAKITGRARSDDYSLLSVISQTFWTISKVCEAGPKDFYPPPRVASRVLRFQKKVATELRVEERKRYLRFVKQAFSQRRKKLSSNLAQMAPPEDLTICFDQMKINDNARAEELSWQQYVELFGRLMRKAAL